MNGLYFVVSWYASGFYDEEVTVTFLCMFSARRTQGAKYGRSSLLMNDEGTILPIIGLSTPPAIAGYRQDVYFRAVERAMVLVLDHPY